MTQTQPITPERFASGLTYAQFVAQAQANRAGFEQSHCEFVLADADRRFFADLNQRHGPLKVLAIVEDWCPDVIRGLPVMARVAEATGMELRLFRRDENPDIRDEYLKDGKFASIPVFVFFDRDFHHLGHWIERPASASQRLERVRQELERSELSKDERRAELIDFMEAQRIPWQQETVREIRELLSRHGGR